MRLLAAVVTVTLTLAACSGGDAPAGGNSRAVAGRRIFQSMGCTVCHTTTDEPLLGPGLAERMRSGRLLSGQDMTDDNLKAWIRTGGSGPYGIMPPQPQLNEQQLADLVAYLRTLR